jgi:PAS domain-containing protein
MHPSANYLYAPFSANESALYSSRQQADHYNTLIAYNSAANHSHLAASPINNSLNSNVIHTNHLNELNLSYHTMDPSTHLHAATETNSTVNSNPIAIADIIHNASANQSLAHSSNPPVQTAWLMPADHAAAAATAAAAQFMPHNNANNMLNRKKRGKSIGEENSPYEQQQTSQILHIPSNNPSVYIPADITVATNTSLLAVPGAKEAVKKAKHREIDANRRARESAAVLRLSNLTSSPNHVINANSLLKRDKVTTLELAGDKIEQLEDLIGKLNQQLTNEKNKSTSLSHQITQYINKLKQFQQNHTGANPSNNPAEELKIAAARKRELDNINSLYTSLFVNSSVIMCVVQVSTGRCVDVNQQFCYHTGWEREQVIGKIFCSAADAIPHILAATKHKYSQSGSVEFIDFDVPHAKTKMADLDPSEIPPICAPAEIIANALTLKQYPATISALERLYSRQEAAVQCIFRLVLSLGQLVEVKATCWLGLEADQNQLPKHLIVVTTADLLMPV